MDAEVDRDPGAAELRGTRPSCRRRRLSRRSETPSKRLKTEAETIRHKQALAANEIVAEGTPRASDDYQRLVAAGRSERLWPLLLGCVPTVEAEASVSSS